MAVARTPQEKLAAVKEAYLLHIIPGVQRVYERTNQVRESFILAHCAILSLSGFYAGAKETNGATYRRFVIDFFPSGYSPNGLWKDLRNSLIHGYTLPSTYMLAHKHPQQHLQLMRDWRNERTGELADLVCLNFEDFADDLREATRLYFETAKGDRDLLKNLCSRYDIAPLATYISDKDIAEYARTQTKTEPKRSNKSSTVM
jgi:hypothetical protein